jgi:glycosyltransferase involved in cell wall biosynthesis
MIARKHLEDSNAGLTIIIPAYNEQDGIASVLTELHHVMIDSGWPHEVIVVDDGSTDNTAAQVDQVQNRLLRHPNNRGYGAALKTGIRHARYALIAMTDADGTYPNECIPQLLEILQHGEYDMVVGARTGEQVTVPIIRRPVKWAITRLAEFVADQPIPDLNSGLRVFRRSAILQFFDLLPDGFSFTTTITLAMLSNDYLVKYMPINYHPRIGQSKIRPIQDTFNFIGLILRIALYFVPLKIFIPLGGFLLLLGLLWGLFTKLVLGQLADVSTLVIVMAAIQVAIVGLLAELINQRIPNYYRDDNKSNLLS